MELRICCDALVSISGEFQVRECKCSVNDYDFNDSNLTGNVLINGMYHKSDEDLEFNELVPFRIVFKNEDYKIINLLTEGLSYYEVVNQGLECEFEIVVLYELINEDKLDLEDKDEEEIELEEEMEEVIEVPLIEEVEFESIKETDLEDSKISEKYDELLKNVFQEQNREQNENVSLKVKEDFDCVDFSKFKETRSLVSVYYTKCENEVDKICAKENVSVKSVYENDANKDYNNKRRIIISK